MDINGTHQFASATPQQVWNALMNPEVLKSCIPGAEAVEVTTNSLTATIRVNLPFVNGAFTGTANIIEQTPPSHAVLTLDRSGSFGSVKGQVTVDLAPANAGTTLTYSAHADTGGKVGMIPNMALEPAVKSGLGTFFKNLESKI